MDSGLHNCRNLLKTDVGKYIIPELGQICKQISFFHEIDIESQKENGYKYKLIRTFKILKFFFYLWKLGQTQGITATGHSSLPATHV